MTKTSAPRSTIVHSIDGRAGVTHHQTRCGRRISDEWAGEHTAEPSGPVNCTRCLKGDEEDRQALEASAAHKVGDRVGILTGVQSVGGPWIGSYGVVTGVRAYWNGRASFLVRVDGESDASLYGPNLLTTDLSGDRQACMDRHPAGKGREVINGYVIRRAARLPSGIRLIMGWNESKREYVVATISDNATEWNAGHYTRNMQTADWNFQQREH